MLKNNYRSLEKYSRYIKWENMSPKAKFFSTPPPPLNPFFQLLQRLYALKIIITLRNHLDEEKNIFSNLEAGGARILAGGARPPGAPP